MWTKGDSKIIRLYTVLQQLFPFNVDKRGILKFYVCTLFYRSYFPLMWTKGDSKIIRLYTVLQELFPFYVDERRSFIQCSFNNKISFLHNRFIILMPQQAMNFLFAISIHYIFQGSNIISTKNYTQIICPFLCSWMSGYQFAIVRYILCIKNI